MLAFERRMALAELLKANPVLTVDELVRRFGVSAQTMRRDFKYLADAGLLTRTHGGAVARSAEALGLEGTFKLRVAERAPEKAAIARAALDLVAPGSTVMMDASTSVLALAQRLPRDIELHAIVNALPIGSELQPPVGHYDDAHRRKHSAHVAVRFRTAGRNDAAPALRRHRVHFGPRSLARTRIDGSEPG